jgi:ribosomal protein S18 acetylase RimI-like enzyme
MIHARFWEETCANVWPSSAQMLYDGWLLRFAPGYFTNNNSVWPLYGGDLPLGEKISFCEKEYAARGLICKFRLSQLPGHDAIEAQLVDQGYMQSNPNLVMVRSSTDAPEAQIVELGLDAWLETIYHIHPVDDPTLIIRERRWLKKITLPSRLAVLMRHGAACAYGRSVLQGNILNIEKVWTLPEMRSQGLGTQLIHGLLRRGFEDGAETAFLTVNESNSGARRLYTRLGFVNQYLYRYLVPQE